MKKALLILAVVAVGATMMLDAEQNNVPVQPRDTVVYTDSTRTDSIAMKVCPVINTPRSNFRGN